MKDHKPGDFARENGYKSDYEVATNQGSYINTNNGSGNQNSYIYQNGNHGSHEHFGYDPSNGKSFWHGANFETENNKPRD